METNLLFMLTLLPLFVEKESIILNWIIVQSTLMNLLWIVNFQSIESKDIKDKVKLYTMTH